MSNGLQILSVLAAATVSSVVLMLVLYRVARGTGNAGIVDVGWSFGLGLLALALAVVGGGDGLRRLLLAFCAGAWAFRLGVYILFNRVIGAREDGRYAALKASWGKNASRELLRFYLTQAVFIVVFALPFVPVVSSTRPFPGVWDAVGLAVWLIAVVGESVADWQLAAWRKNPENLGHTCRRGLWRYSRHPNYFFEWLHWWTYVFLAVRAPLWWLALLGPVLMLYFLYRVTGIPYAEAQALRSRGEDYREYQRSTSPFIPWFPRSKK